MASRSSQGKSNVDVRRVRAAGVEKTLEKEVVEDRVDVGDAEGVGDQGGRRAAPAAGARRLFGDLLHDQEVVGKSLCRG